MKVLIFTAIHGRQEITELFLMGIKRLQMFPEKNPNTIKLLCVASEPEDIEFLKSKGIDVVQHPNNPLSKKMEFCFREALKRDFDYLMNLGSDDLLDHDVFPMYYNKLMAEGVECFGMKTIGVVNFETLEAGLYCYNYHRRQDMILGAGRMLSRSLCLKFKDKALYPGEKNNGLDMLSENQIKQFTKLTPVETARPMLVDVKSKTNIWKWRDVIKGSSRLDFDKLTHFTSKEEDKYLRRTPTGLIVAVIPVKGRLPLLGHTIRRLYEKNGVHTVICVGEGPADRNECEHFGAEWVEFPNKPLGKKWNAGFLKAKEYNPDACLFVGSSDWISDNWIEYTSGYLREYDLIGKPDFNLLDFGKQLRACHWRGYTDHRRANEPIGIGRILSKRILDKLGWQPMDNHLDSSLDWSMYQKILAAGGRVKLLRTDEIQSLSLSTSAWENKHSFESHWQNKRGVESMKIDVNYITELFPEALEL